LFETTDAQVGKIPRPRKIRGNWGNTSLTSPFSQNEMGKELYMKYALIVSSVLALATPALAEEIGVGVGPVSAGVTVGEGHRDYDRERDRDRTTVIKEREPSDRTTVIKKDNEDGSRTKTVIHDRD
jgi:hypothetical protein